MSLSRAQEFLAAAELCLAHGYSNASASRSYYVMYLAARTAFQAAGIVRGWWPHPLLQSRFARELVDQRKVHPARLAKYLEEALIRRVDADYGSGVTADRARETLMWAREFLTLVEKEVAP